MSRYRVKGHGNSGRLSLQTVAFTLDPLPRNPHPIPCIKGFPLPLSAIPTSPVLHSIENNSHYEGIQ